MLSCVAFGVGFARDKSGFCGLLGSNWVESCLVVSAGISVAVAMSSLSTSAVLGVSMSLSMMDSLSSRLSGSWG